mgnify:CR=1 FL=1
MQMVMLVFYNAERIETILDIWEMAGVGGITILEGMGSNKSRRADRAKRRCFTLFGIVADKAAACECIEATERALGTLREGESGFMTSWDLSVLKGMANPALVAWAR